VLARQASRRRADPVLAVSATGDPFGGHAEHLPSLQAHRRRFRATAEVTERERTSRRALHLALAVKGEYQRASDEPSPGRTVSTAIAAVVAGGTLESHLGEAGLRWGR
jgi:hypothetical protein